MVKMNNLGLTNIKNESYSNQKQFRTNNFHFF